MRVLPFALPLLLLLACEDNTVAFDTDSGNTGNPDGNDTGDTGIVAGSIAVAPSAITLDTLFVGQTASAPITVTNIGTGSVEVTLSVVGGHSAQWTLDAYTSDAAPGETTTHNASLTPIEWGDYSVSVLVDDAISAGHVEIPVTAHVQVDADRDGFGSVESGGGDCDDTNAVVNPGATEAWYDGVDSNCDGANDYDQDGDGSNLGIDCDDLDANAVPGGTEVWYDGVDGDCDGANDYDQDADGHDASAYGGDDCDDLDAAVHPEAAEVWYDGVDSNCDGANDFDQDGDGVDVSTDCDDTNATVYPGATETWYNGVDNNCDGANDYDQDADGVDVGADCDDTDSSVYPGASDAWYDGVDSDCAGNSDYDVDGDGYDDSAYAGDDCDDTNAAVHPGATETWYDGVDSNCDGANDNDQDGDGAEVSSDCDDTDATVYPGATDAWYDGVDSDCAGNDDWDQDGDGVDYPTDCNDTDASVVGPVAETWDGMDNDCDGVIDDFSASDAASGVLYGSTASMALGNKGQLAMDADLTGDGAGDLVLVESGTSYGYAWVLEGADAASAAGNVGDYDTLQVAGEQYYNLTYVDGPFSDVDGDGTHDSLLGGYYSSYYGVYGRVYEFDGGTTGSKSVSSYNARFSGSSTYYGEGNSHGAGGDFDGDGSDDVVIGAQRGDYSSGSWTGSDTDCGTLGMFQGPVSGSYDTGDADDVIYGYTDYDYLGVSLTVADVDGDGYADVLSGASGYDGGASGGGAVFVVAGSSSFRWDSKVTDAASIEIDGDVASQGLGADSLAHPGDVDGDGNLDLGLSLETTGAAWLFLDGTSLSGSMDVSDASYIVSGTAGDVGSALVLDTDFDGDGADEFVVGSDGDDTAGTDAGALFIFSYASSWGAALTSADATATIYGSAAGEAFGSGAAGGEDLDGDGTEDLAVGATANDTSATNGGAVYVIPGR